MSKKAPPHARKLLVDVLDYEYFDILQAAWYPGAKDQRLFVVTGPNASGKSFVSTLLSGYVRRTYDIEPMHVGMKHRTNGYMKCLVWGSEDDQSTGLNSYHSVKGAIRTCQGRDTPHVVILDEPDIGLSEAFQGALGQVIADFARDLPQHTVAFGVVTHSRRLLRHLLPLEPHHIRLDDKLTLREVVETEPADLTPEQVEAVDKLGLERWRALNRLIEKRKK